MLWLLCIHQYRKVHNMTLLLTLNSVNSGLKWYNHSSLRQYRRIVATRYWCTPDFSPYSYQAPGIYQVHLVSEVGGLSHGTQLWTLLLVMTMQSTFWRASILKGPYSSALSRHKISTCPSDPSHRRATSWQSCRATLELPSSQICGVG